MVAPVAPGRVLPTLNEDGTRRWLRPKPSPGAWFTRRTVVAWLLIVVYIAIPHVFISGKPAMLLDLQRREFTFFGTTFLPTDTLLLMLLAISLVIAIFLASALAGRVWCGWGCPQTVYMEFVYRPIERLFEGGARGSAQLDRDKKHFHPRRLGKLAVYLVISSFLAHTFLAYFVGWDQVVHWVFGGPSAHPVGFAIVTMTTIAMMLDFAYFREQTCMVACPYGRWQSALLDNDSLIVAYDYNRGEPRGKGKERTGKGDCVDCMACVTTCPTGIDIRNGLQMECIHCTQCMDACDAVMEKVGKPKGLIRYSSRAALAGKGKHFLRTRTILYPIAFAAVFGAFLYQLTHKDAADVTLLGPAGAPFTLEPDGNVVNQLRVRIANRTGADRAYTVEVTGAEGMKVIAPLSPLSVKPGRTETMPVFVTLPADDFEEGVRTVTVKVTDGGAYTGAFQYRLAGPMHDEDKSHDRRERDGEERK
ncbi:MAG: cytochrome c oxidase accessory protein CcoG [Gemmatimonadaceae bacterium]|nr:cytochrome c oxidase accessory protein CcoG [Gemmatimonadaceae bacterium]